ncbi:MAG: twin-arginine translocase TatA/TatE family subunit [Flavobacteriales bacterium]
MGKFGVTEIVLILAVVLLFFGGRKIPELMRGLGRGVKEFKDASKGEGSETPEKPENQ